MTRDQRSRWSLRTGALCAAALLSTTLLAPSALADDLPPPQVRRGTRARVVLPRRAPVAVRPAPAPTRPIRGYSTGKPSEPVAARGGTRHSTYVPPLGAAPRALRSAQPARTRPEPRPVAATPRAGRVPVTTFRVAPAPIPRRIAPAPKPRRTAVAPRRTTWGPRPVPVAPSRSGASRRVALPSPSVTKVSPSYADLERTRAQSVTARTRPDTSSARRRTLQRRGSGSTLRRRAVRSNDLSVPMAPGQCAPRPPVRRSLPLLPPPGCDGGG